MSKSNFIDNCSATAICGRAISITKVYDLVQGKLKDGHIVALVPGDQYVDTFQGHEYVCHKMFTFLSDGTPDTIELIPKSSHSFSHFGKAGADGKKPRVPRVESKNHHMVPDFSYIEEVVTPFKFKVITMDRGADGSERVNAKVEHLQFARVTGFATYWQAVYDSNQNARLDDLAEQLSDGSTPCQFKRVRKPCFELIDPTSELLAHVNKALQKK